MGDSHGNLKKKNQFVAYRWVLSSLNNGEYLRVNQNTVSTLPCYHAEITKNYTHEGHTN